MAAAVLASARAEAQDTPEIRLLEAELVDLAARIGVLDEQLAALEPDRQAAQSAVAAIEAKIAALQAELSAAAAVRRKVLGKVDSLRMTRTQLKAKRSVKGEDLARLQQHGERPTVRWGGVMPRRA
jgi:chromosome segregation ATPase